MKRFRLETWGVSAEAELLEANSPQACEAFWSMLPLETDLVSAKWSGDVVALHPGKGPVNEISELENPVCSIYPGAIVMRPRGSEILIGYGVGEYRWAVGVDYTTRIGKIVTNRAQFLEAIGRTPLEGPNTCRLTPIED